MYTFGPPKFLPSKQPDLTFLKGLCFLAFRWLVKCKNQIGKAKRDVMNEFSDLLEILQKI